MSATVAQNEKKSEIERFYNVKYIVGNGCGHSVLIIKLLTDWCLLLIYKNETGNALFDVIITLVNV